MLNVGDVIGRLTILEKRKKSEVVCRCICGTVKVIKAYNIQAGRTVSCGCRWVETLQPSGLPTNTPTHNSWENMLNRCNPNTVQGQNSANSYAGISVDERWRGPDGFRHFYEDMGLRPAGTSVDRIDNSQGYFKENCRWATRKEQQNNLRSNVHFSYQGKDYRGVNELAGDLGVTYMVAWHRMNAARKGVKNGILISDS